MLTIEYISNIINLVRLINTLQDLFLYKGGINKSVYR